MRVLAPPEAAAALPEAPGPPFGPGSMTWRVNLEPVVFLGAARALLMQVAHPLVAARVDQHSNYRQEPWTRLYRTLDVMLKLSFADPTTSRRQQARLRRAHAPVRGVSSNGVAYDARDPALMTWVWATLVDTSALVYQRVFGPLSVVELERFHREQRRVGEACGIPGPALPSTCAAFEAYVEDTVSNTLQVTREAAAIARSIFEIPAPAVVGRSVGRLNRALASGLLPEPLRDAYGLTWDPRREAWLRRLFAAARTGARVVPGRMRRYPVQFVVRR